MGGGENVAEAPRSCLAAPLSFFLIVILQFLSKWLDQLKKKGAKNKREMELRAEIKQLLKEASSLSQPSTFAQAAKLRRMATAKEKELANCQEQHSKESRSSYELYGKVLFVSKVVTYLVLICWFWRVPIAVVSEQLVQPFGRLLSWGAGAPVNGNLMVGVIPWLILSTRVSKYICRLSKF